MAKIFWLLRKTLLWLLFGQHLDTFGLVFIATSSHNICEVNCLSHIFYLVAELKRVHDEDGVSGGLRLAVRVAVVLSLGVGNNLVIVIKVHQSFR